ncbi:MAG: hypothetical protein ICV54_30530 [Nostoc sp. C3-bin3]|nr:hypothetical protein [Nostoc sp. C3-bin3]
MTNIIKTDYLKNGAKDRDGWDILEEEIDRLFESNNKVMIESLGAGEGFAIGDRLG